MKSIIGEIIRKYRVENDMTQEQLSEKAEISLRFLQNIEAGDHAPSFSTLFRLSKALDVTPDKIILKVWKEWLKEN